MVARSIERRRGLILGLLVLPISLTLVGCTTDPDQVRVCETQLKDRLKSPASYKRINVDTFQIDSSIHKPPYDEVTITYDATNSYNALLRDKETCFFKPGTTDVIENPFLKEAEAESQRVADAALNAAESAINAAGNAVANPSEAIEDTTTSPDSGRLDRLDACLENASTSEQYEQCNAEGDSSGD